MLLFPQHRYLGCRRESAAIRPDQPDRTQKYTETFIWRKK